MYYVSTNSNHIIILFSGYTIDQLKPGVCFVSDVLYITNRDAITRDNLDDLAVAYSVFGDASDSDTCKIRYTTLRGGEERVERIRLYLYFILFSEFAIKFK